jgi:serine/threonine protein kinase
MMLFGSPSEQQTKKLNPKYNWQKMPYVDAQSINNYFHKTTPKEAIDLLLALLDYDPGRRITAISALAHPFFDDLRHEKTRLPDGSPLPDFIFDFTEEELSEMKRIAGG